MVCLHCEVPIMLDPLQPATDEGAGILGGQLGLQGTQSIVSLKGSNLIRERLVCHLMFFVVTGWERGCLGNAGHPTLKLEDLVEGRFLLQSEMR